MFNKMDVRHQIFVLFTASFSNLIEASSSEEIRRIVRADGSVEYTDSPDAHGESEASSTLVVKSPNIIQAISPKTEVSIVREERVMSRSVEILAPSDQEVIPMGPGNLLVSVLVKPALDEAEQLQLLIDNEPAALPQRSTDWHIKGVSRGVHSLQVLRRHGSSEHVQASRKIEILVLRPLPARK